MDSELLAALETFCKDYHIKDANGLWELHYLYQMRLLQGIPDGKGGYIGVDKDRWCESCSMRVDKESLVDYTKEVLRDSKMQ